MTRGTGRLRTAVARVVGDENLDMYILAVAAVLFTVLGTVGMADVETLSAVTLALLALLATSQIRARRHIAEVLRSQRTEPTALLLTGFPEELSTLRSTSTDMLLIGIALSRTVQTSREDLRRSLTRGGKVRVLLLDPTNEALVRSVRPHHLANLDEERLRTRIRQSLDELVFLRDTTRGGLEIRVAPFVPAMNVNALNPGTPQGVIVLQHNEHKPPGEAAPILRLRAEDGYWYDHFAAEAERMWDDGLAWPTTLDQTLARSPRPVLMDDFGPTLLEGMAAGQELLITGITRNTLVNTNYNRFEQWLSRGCRIRFLLLDPGCEAVTAAADRYYAERSVESTRHRIEQTLRLLTELKQSTGGRLSARLTRHPLAMGAVAIDATPGQRTAASAVFLEYFTYQAAGEPKFILQPHHGRWFDHFVGEAEALWAGASHVDLDAPPSGSGDRP